MQLHACLLLFIITTDKTLALLQHHCGGNVSLDQEPAGHINLTLPGHFTDNRFNPMNPQSDKTLFLCTWILDIPLGRTVLLKLLRLSVGSRISVRCVWNGEDQVLESLGVARLSGCDKATITWTGLGHSSNTVQLYYCVQEGERNSSGDHTTQHPDGDPVHGSQTGTDFTSIAPASQEVVRGTEGGRGRHYEGLKWRPGPQSVSSPSSQDKGLLYPTSTLRGLSVAGAADRETLPFPEEGANNGADASGAAHLTDSPISARDGTHPYFHTERTLSTDTSNTETNPNGRLPQTQKALAYATSSVSNIMFGKDLHKYTVTQTSMHVDEHATTRAHPAVSSFSFLPLTSTPPQISSRTTWESGTDVIPSGRTVSEEKQPHSWRSHRSTGTLLSDLSSAVTSNPLKSSTEPPQYDSISADTDTEATALTSSSQGPGRTQSSTAHIAEFHTAVTTVAAASFHLNISQTDSLKSADVTSETAAFESSDKFDSAVELHTPTSSTQRKTSSRQSTESFTHSSYTSSTFTQTSKDIQTATQSTQRDLISPHVTTNDAPSSTDITKVNEQTLSFTSSSSTLRAALTMGGVVRDSADTGATSETLHPTHPLLHENSHTNSQAPVSLFSPSTSTHSSTPSNMLQTHTTFSGSSHVTRTPPPLTSSTSDSTLYTLLIDHKAMSTPLQTTKSTSLLTPRTHHHLPFPSSTNVPATHKHSHNNITTTHISPLLLTTAKSDYGDKNEGQLDNTDFQTGGNHTVWTCPSWGPPSSLTSHPSQQSHVVLTPSALPSTPAWSSTTSQPPRFFIVPDQPAAVRVESFELLLQIIVEESRSAFTTSLEKDAAAWVELYLQKAPGFGRLLGVWSSGHAVQSLVEFKTSGALQWLSMTGPASLLERTGLAQAVREGRSFRSSKITNVTLGGMQADVCDWLLQCPEGYKCVSLLGTAKYSCSSVCRFDHCHHHGICTHHPDQLPVCHCAVGEDFWYMGPQCDVRMTQARLVGACLAILLLMVTLIGVLALVAVRRYRAVLIQAKVDQTRSSYRRFNHFDELSGRFWLRSWAGSADSMDNPAFTRSDELLHLRALDRPCCYHDDTLSLASTCTSHGPHINTIYPHSSQYGWRGSEMSMGDGVLDSGKASDLSVCSWPVEPIQWTPFPLLQQLASHKTPTVRVSRPRSYCEGMELVDLGKSWTA
uniref:uncharacterized protein LOC109973302 n=1 Tax=Monopterus albus TaxID=43700 RepID=UPI0009B3A15F|nr:uncharacterized protein LOC109973302 [Monopterus albus]